MYRKFHDRFGTAGVVIAVIALIAALGGTALAAGALTSKQKKEVEKIAKKYAGKQGPAGPAGTNGTNGTNGANGEKGANGTNGTDGAPGAPGTDGKNIVTGTEPAGAHCTQGGVWTEVEGSGVKKYVCNGANGTTGFTETLPAGKSLRGEWGTTFNATASPQAVYLPISFGIPLELAPTPRFIPPGVPAAGATGDLTSGSKIVTNISAPTSGELSEESLITGTGIPAGTRIKKCFESGTPEPCSAFSNELELSAAATASGTGVALSTVLPSGCTGTFASPGAEEGFLCVFAQSKVNLSNPFASFPGGYSPFINAEAPAFGAAGKSGTLIALSAQAAGLAQAVGTWVVTAE